MQHPRSLEPRRALSGVSGCGREWQPAPRRCAPLLCAAHANDGLPVLVLRAHGAPAARPGLNVACGHTSSYSADHASATCRRKGEAAVQQLVRTDTDAHERVASARCKRSLLAKRRRQQLLGPARSARAPSQRQRARLWPQQRHSSGAPPHTAARWACSPSGATRLRSPCKVFHCPRTPHTPAAAAQVCPQVGGDGLSTWVQVARRQQLLLKVPPHRLR